MTNQFPLTLDEILAAGEAILTAQSEARKRERQEEQEFQVKVHLAILTAAAREIPAAVMEFATVEQNEYDGESWAASVMLNIPNALPVEAMFHSYKGEHDSPDSWKPAGGQRECLRIHNEPWTRPLFALPAVLAHARVLYAERQPVALQPEPKPEPPAPVATPFYEGLINLLDLADLRFLENGTEKDRPGYLVQWVTARALVGICVNLEDIAMTLGRFEDRQSF